MKLWVDDRREAPPGWVWAKTAPEAINHIATGEVEEISLDHDLGEEMNGHTVATYIEGAAHSGEVKKMKWRAHTDNPVGRQRIEQAMRNADEYWK